MSEIDNEVMRKIVSLEKEASDSWDVFLNRAKSTIYKSVYMGKTVKHMEEILLLTKSAEGEGLERYKKLLREQINENKKRFHSSLNQLSQDIVGIAK